MRRLIDQALRAGLRSLGTRKARRVACPTFSMGAPMVDLTKAGEILTGTGTAGNLTTDAHLAALAIENGAVLCSTDGGDFSRFRGLRWVNPLG